MNRPSPILSAALLLLLLPAFSSCGSGKDKPQVYTGTIEVVDVDVASTIPGRLVEVAVAEGQRVAAGDVLFTVDDTMLKAQRAQAEAAVATAKAAVETVKAQRGAATAQASLAERESKRTKSMLESGVGTEQSASQLDGQLGVARAQATAAGRAINQAEATVAQAEAALALLDEQLADTRTLAPSAGVVLSRNREPGEVVGAGASVITLGDLDHPKLRVYVPLTTLERIALGTPAEIRLDASPDKAYAGKVSWIAAEAEFTPRDILTPEERVKQVFAVDVSLDPAPGLHPGVPADAVFQASPNAAPTAK